MAAASPNEFASAWKGSVERSFAILSMQAQVAEKMVSANTSAFQSLCLNNSQERRSENQAYLGSISSVTSFIEASCESAAQFSRQMVEMNNEAKSDANDFATRYVNKWADAQILLLEDLARKAPPGLGVSLEAMKEAMKLAKIAYQNFLLSLRQPPVGAERSDKKG